MSRYFERKNKIASNHPRTYVKFPYNYEIIDNGYRDFIGQTKRNL